MELFATWCGFLGSWLLVAGPIYQASLELREEQIAAERIHETRAKVTQERHASAWWWLLPPVIVLLERRSNKQYQEAFFAALPDEDVADMVTFINKANGWLYVASGGLLLAVNETYELSHMLHWHFFTFWAVVIALAAASVINTAYRNSRSERIVRKHS